MTEDKARGGALRQLLVVALGVALAVAGVTGCYIEATTGGEADGDSDADSDADADEGEDGDPGDEDPGDEDPGDEDPGDEDPGDEPVEAIVHFEDDCGDLAGCGGALAGSSWDYTDLCIEPEEVLQAILSVCEGAAVESAVGTVEGRVSFTETTVERHTSGEVDVVFNLPASCVAPLGGCAVLSALLAGEGDLDASCGSDGAGGCDCASTMPIQDDEAETYFVEGTVLVTGGGRRFDYCVDGDTMSYVELGEDAEPGIAELARR